MVLSLRRGWLVYFFGVGTTLAHIHQLDVTPPFKSVLSDIRLFAPAIIARENNAVLARNNLTSQHVIRTTLPHP